jgi:hypothetical protein
VQERASDVPGIVAQRLESAHLEIETSSGQRRIQCGRVDRDDIGIRGVGYGEGDAPSLARLSGVPFVYFDCFVVRSPWLSGPANIRRSVGKPLRHVFILFSQPGMIDRLRPAKGTEYERRAIQDCESRFEEIWFKVGAEVDVRPTNPVWRRRWSESKAPRSRSNLRQQFERLHRAWPEATPLRVPVYEP